MSILYGDEQDVIVQNSNIFLGLPILNPLDPTGGETLVAVWHTDFTITGFDSAYPAFVPETTIVTYGSQNLSVGNVSSTIFGDTASLTLSAISPDVSVPDVTSAEDIQVDLYAVMHYMYNFGNDTITASNGTNALYGDTGNLSLIAKGGNVSGGADTGGMVYANSFHLGADTIKAGNGPNVVYGDTADILLSARDGMDDASLTSTSFAQIINNTISGGSNTITLGNGNNTVYGDSRDITFEAIAGSLYNSQDGTALSQDGGGNIQGNTIDFIGNTITVGNGANTIYGNGRDVTFLTDGGSAKNDALPYVVNVDGNGTFQQSITNAINIFNTITMINDSSTHINDTITIGSGANVVYGDFHNIVFSAINTGIVSGSESISFTSDSQNAQTLSFSLANTLLMGNDMIVQIPTNTTVGSVVSGDIWDLTENAVAGSASGFAYSVSALQFNSFQGGNDIITLGNGNNTIYGDLHDYTINSVAGVDSSGFVLPLDNVPGEALIARETVLAGMDTITSGSGADLIYGDMRDVNWFGFGGITQTGTQQGAMGFNTLHGAHDTVHAGGGNDTVYGDWEDFSSILQGGTILPETIPAIDPVNVFAYSVSVTNNIRGGDDHLYGENGNDTLYGDGKSLSLSLFGGDAGTSGGQAGAHMINTTLTFGNDWIDGGSGNDVLYGDVKALSFVAINGTGTGDASATFSGDILRVNGVAHFVDNGSTITFGNDILDGGAGNDYLAGDAVDLSGIDKFLTGKNHIVWGNDTLTGGKGADQFAFTLLNNGGHFEMQGQDTITDFKASEGDRLVLKIAEGLTLANLNADALFSHPDVGGNAAIHDTLITFHDGGGGALSLIDSIGSEPSITLYDVNLTSFNAANTTLIH